MQTVEDGGPQRPAPTPASAAALGHWDKGQHKHQQQQKHCDKHIALRTPRLCAAMGKKSKSGAARAKKPAYQKRFREHVREQREVPWLALVYLPYFCGDERAEAAETAQNAPSVALNSRCSLR